MFASWCQSLFSNWSDFTAVNTTASEATLLAGVNDQPVIPAFYFEGPHAFGRRIDILARGVLSTTGAPTLTFQTRLGSTQGSSTLTGASVGLSSAITCGTGVTNKWWELQLSLGCKTPGMGSTNCTLFGSGRVTSPAGFVSPFIFPLEPTAPDTATWTSTIDAGVNNFLNLSVTWGTSSASNTITLKELLVVGWN